MMSSQAGDETAATSQRLLASLLHYALENPVKFVALATLAVTAAVPVFAFTVYAAGTVVCTAIAAIVLDLALLTLGACGLALGLCFATCISVGVAGLFWAGYVGYRAAVGGVSRARTRLYPSTVASSSGEPVTEVEETFDKDKHHSKQVGQDLLTSLLRFLDTLSSLTGTVTYTNITTTTARDTEQLDITDGSHSDLCRTTLTVFGLAAAIFFMSYAVLVASYVVVNFT